MGDKDKLKLVEFEEQPEPVDVEPSQSFVPASQVHVLKERLIKIAAVAEKAISDSAVIPDQEEAFVYRGDALRSIVRLTEVA